MGWLLLLSTVTKARNDPEEPQAPATPLKSSNLLPQLQQTPGVK